MSISPLPEDVRAQIKSSVEITSLLDVVEGLLRNALDAGAGSVSITVDFAKGFCAVQDDGSGIPASEFCPNGHLAQIHCTSKLGSRCYGSHGRFLFCLSTLALLSISSRYLHESTFSTAVLKQGNVISRRVGSNDEELGHHGTKVVVHNLFGNVPVRFKQQATRCADMVEVERQFEALRRLLVSYLLALGKPVSLRLRSTSYLRYNHICSADLAGGETFSVRNITSILRQAGLTTHADTWKLASARAGDISVRCAISLTPNPSKRTQFVSLGQHPIPSRGVASVIYDTINGMFDASGFGILENVEDRPLSRPGPTDNPEHDLSSLRRRLVKGVDRWPAFYIRIGSNSSSHFTEIIEDYSPDDSLPPTLQEILALLKLLIGEFLQTHAYRPKRTRTRRRDLRPPAASRQPSNEQKSFDRWKRMKSAFTVSEEEMCSGLPFVDDKPAVNGLSLDDDVQLLLKDIELDPDIVEDNPGGVRTRDISAGAQDAEHTPAKSQNDGDAETTTWTNPRTGKVLCLDARNGWKTVPTLPNPAAHDCPNAPRPHSRVSDRRLPLRPSTSAELADRLKKWPTASLSTKSQLPIPSLVREDSQADDKNSETEQKIEAAQLVNAQVLQQVDNKFILALVPTSSHMEESSSLVLIDQHAADERIKVEEFFQQLCSCESVPLARPIVFEMSKEEVKRFDQAQPYFASWAIEYHLRHRDAIVRKPDQQASIAVTQLPAMIAERCRLEPSVLIQMLRKEIWSNDTNRLSSRHPINDASWIFRLSQCPEGLVEMINSRACRSAIMFNDILTNKQCEKLLRRLSRCSLPFQCAHGRPNTTVLTTFGNEVGVGSQDQERQIFGTAFRRWCR